MFRSTAKGPESLDLPRNTQSTTLAGKDDCHCYDPELIVNKDGDTTAAEPTASANAPEPPAVEVDIPEEDGGVATEDNKIEKASSVVEKVEPSMDIDKLEEGHGVNHA